jgi:hypothetical protein
MRGSVEAAELDAVQRREGDHENQDGHDGVHDVDSV